MGLQDDDAVQQPGPEAGEVATRRSETRVIIFFAVVAAVPVLAGGVVAGVLASGDGDRAGSWWWWTLLLGTPVLCLGVLGFGTVAAIRWQQRRQGKPWPNSALNELPSHRERSALLRALRRGDPIPVAQRDLALRVAREQTRLSWLLWFYPIFVVVWALNAVSRDGWDRYLHIGLSIGWLALLGYMVWVVRRMRTRVRELEVDA